MPFCDEDPIQIGWNLILITLPLDFLRRSWGRGLLTPRSTLQRNDLFETFEPTHIVAWLLAATLTDLAISPFSLSIQRRADRSSSISRRRCERCGEKSIT